MQTLVPSDLTCVTHTCVHGTYALCETSMSKYSSGLACMQANLNLVKIPDSHFGVLHTQNAKVNMPNMILIAYLDKNFPNCNKNLGQGKSEPLAHSYMFWY